LFPEPREIFSEEPGGLLEEWRQIFAVRDAALQALEAARQEKKIGKALEADVEIRATGKTLELLRSHADGLKEILNVSRVTVLDGSEVDRRGADVFYTVLPARGQKCARCWNFMPEVSNYGIWENVCTRCQGALTEMGIARPQADAGEAA
jgi:isoleucyl-tRNA synthetase